MATIDHRHRLRRSSSQLASDARQSSQSLCRFSSAAFANGTRGRRFSTDSGRGGRRETKPSD